MSATLCARKHVISDKCGENQLTVSKVISPVLHCASLLRNAILCFLGQSVDDMFSRTFLLRIIIRVISALIKKWRLFLNSWTSP